MQDYIIDINWQEPGVIYIHTGLLEDPENIEVWAFKIWEDADHCLRAKIDRECPAFLQFKQLTSEGVAKVLADNVLSASIGKVCELLNEEE